MPSQPSPPNRPSAGRGRREPTEPAGELRQRVNTASRPILVRLSALPRPVVPLVMVALAAVALLAPLTYAVPGLVLLVIFVGWLAYLSWPVLTSGGRGLRVLVLIVLVAYGVLRITR